jgi:hypothetical protein
MIFFNKFTTFKQIAMAFLFTVGMSFAGGYLIANTYNKGGSCEDICHVYSKSVKHITDSSIMSFVKASR